MHLCVQSVCSSARLPHCEINLLTSLPIWVSSRAEHSASVYFRGNSIPASNLLID
jgi:hypothetical protein